MVSLRDQVTDIVTYSADAAAAAAVTRLMLLVRRLASCFSLPRDTVRDRCSA